MRKLKICSGVALLETLVALVLLTVGVLGLSWMHQQTLTQQRQQVARDNAMRVADNMAQRMLMLSSPLHARQWQAFLPLSATTCENTACTDDQWALALRQQANQDLQGLPMGDMSIVPLSNLTNTWAITVAWEDPKETHRTDNAWNAPSCPASKSCWRLVFRGP